MFDTFHIKNGLKHGDALLPLLVNFDVEYAIRKANQEGLKLNNTHQVVVYADDDMLGTDTYYKKTQALVVASNGIRLEVNAKETKYIGMSRDQNAGQSHNIKIDNKSFERAEQFRYFITVLTNQNRIQEEIKSMLKSGNFSCHLMQNLLPSCLLSKNIRLRYTELILPVVLYRCETWSLTLQEEWRLRVFENRVPRRIFGLRRDEVTREWKRLHNEELYDLYSPNIRGWDSSVGVVTHYGLHGLRNKSWWE